MGYSQGRMSQKMKNIIIAYYKELYLSYEVKTIGEIASDLNINRSTLYIFYNEYYSSCNLDGTYSPLTTMIMLCTKFYCSSKFYEEQQSNFGEIIRKRAMVKEIKNRTAQLNEKRKVKRL